VSTVPPADKIRKRGYKKFWKLTKFQRKLKTFLQNNFKKASEFFSPVPSLIIKNNCKYTNSYSPTPDKISPKTIICEFVIFVILINLWENLLMAENWRKK
jgi:hypothetical protein